jgi:Tfp pilus assembly protein FimT
LPVFECNSGNDNQQVDASTLFIQQPTSAAMEMYSTKASNAITSDTTGSNEQHQEQEGCFQYTQVTTTNNHASTQATMIPEDLTAKNQYKAL